MDKNDEGFLASRIGCDTWLGRGVASTSGQPQTSDLEGGAGTPLQVSGLDLRPGGGCRCTWGGVFQRLGKVTSI